MARIRLSIPYGVSIAFSSISPSPTRKHRACRHGNACTVQILTNAVELCKSNTEFDAAPLRQILTKRSKIKRVYEAFCAK